MFCLALVCAGCSAPGAAPQFTGAHPNSLLPSGHVRNIAAGSLIKHVIIIIQENRSFDNIFAGFPGADAPTYGYAIGGARYPLRPINFNTVDVDHGWGQGITDYDHGKMDGYSHALSIGAPLPASFAYAYLQRSLVKPYWTMAQQYVQADRMFQTEFGGRFSAHLDLIAGTTALSSTTSIVNSPSGIPWSCTAPAGTNTWFINTALTINPNGPFPCFTQFATMADTLDLAGVSWKFYAPALSFEAGQLWSSFATIKNVRYGRIGRTTSLRRKRRS